ncbi:MAG: hypothetical protein J6S67_10805 [Methanobrevibacter sp.]|nr:hypothetical protein [Methanobrevibacter sp.]
MAMIDEMTDTGELDTTSIADYKARAPYILTSLQNEIIGVENRYRKYGEYIRPVPITDLDNQDVQVDDIQANTLLVYGLAAKLMADENKALANFMQQEYERLSGIFLKPKPVRPESREDIYDASLTY